MLLSKQFPGTHKRLYESHLVDVFIVLGFKVTELCVHGHLGDKLQEALDYILYCLT